jgi:diguanylate cyclase (GGDEF)-like protein
MTLLTAVVRARDRGFVSPVPLRVLAQWVAGPPRVWVFNLVLATVAAGLFLIGIRGLPALDAPIAIEWWHLAIAYGLAEILVVHLQFRRDTHSFSLSEIPLLIGLFFVPPDQLLLALLAGSGAALTLHRRQPAVKLGFNLANLALSTSLAIILFRVILGAGDPLGPHGWGAAFAAAISADIVSVVMITGAISLATSRPPDVPKLLGSGSLASFFNTCLALVTVTVMWIRPLSAWQPLILAALMFGAYRIYGGVRQKHESLEVLYESTRLLQQSTDVDRVIATLLRQGREMFRADTAEIVIIPTETEAGLEATIQGDRFDSRAITTLDPREGVWARVASEARGIYLPRPIPNDRLREHFSGRGIRDALVAPLFGHDAVIGTILVGNRQSDVATFRADDLRLFETYANHASASLENARLIDRLQRHVAETRHQALHDALTGLPNRALFRDRVKTSIDSGGGNGEAAILLMDLDRFKEVNDTLGHHNGDLLLEAVAARLVSIVRPGDVVARLGGDEFAVLVTNAASRDTVASLAGRIIQGLATPFVIQEMTLEVGASIGIAVFPDHGADVDTLVQRADVAMYQAKTSLLGHQFYAPELDSYSPTRLMLLGDLRKAIEDRELSVVYQPKVDVRDGAIVGAEALARWVHPARGFVPPDEFIPIAEHTGLLRPLTLLVLEAAIEECARWRAGGHPISVAVNLSVRNLVDAELPDDIARLLARYGLPAHALELEITESALVADPGRTYAVLHRLHELGLGISIDDFGTGYSSLSYLRRMPVDEVKIDKSFVIGMATDENDALIVRSTIDLCINLGLRVVAEGVETPEIWEQLANLGCHVAQGFYFGRPVGPDAFARVLETRATTSYAAPPRAMRLPSRLPAPSAGRQPRPPWRAVDRTAQAKAR